MPVTVAGPAAQTTPLRDCLARAVGPAFDVQAVPTPAAAAREVCDQDLGGAYVPAADRARVPVRRDPEPALRNPALACR